MNKFHIGFLTAIIALFSFTAGFGVGTHFYPMVLGEKTEKKSTSEEVKEYPLREYNLQNLQSREYHVSEIQVEKVLGQFPTYTAYQFSYKTTDKKMTGQLNVPKAERKEYPVIVLLRGYVEQEKYTTGEGTRPAAAAFAEKGYVTFAPDFLGFGGSDAETVGWQSRFEKPVNVVELIRSIRAHLDINLQNKRTITINPKKLGMWAHSNGGQIALTTLEALGEPIPTTLWAPVTAPFPYSILYFSDEMDDEGKSMRSAVAGLEKEYNVQEFSLTQYLNRLQGPLQLHHGTADLEAPKTWSDEFIQKLNLENTQRELLRKEKKEAAEKIRQELLTATASSEVATNTATLASTEGILNEAETENPFLSPLDINYFVYPGANHSLRPGWEKVIERDLEFFDKNLNH